MRRETRKKAKAAADIYQRGLDTNQRISMVDAAALTGSNQPYVQQILRERGEHRRWCGRWEMIVDRRSTRTENAVDLLEMYPGILTVEKACARTGASPAAVLRRQRQRRTDRAIARKRAREERLQRRREILQSSRTTTRA